MNEYKKVKLGDVCEFVRNGASIKQNPLCKNGIPITRIETISNDKFNFDRLGYADITDEKYSDYYLRDSDVLLSHINSAKYLGRSVMYKKVNDTPIIHGMNLLCLRFIQERYYPAFFVYYSQSNPAKAYIGNNTKLAVNQASITASAIKEMPIPLPPIETQKQIAATLDKTTKIIAENKRLLEKYDLLIKSRFIEMFGDNKYPKNSISEMVEGKVPSAKKLFNKTDEIKYIDISSVDNKINEIVGYTDYIFEEAPSRAQQHIRKNDILISTVRPNLKNIAINRLEYKEMVASSGFCVLRPKCIPEYLFVAVLQDKFTSDMVAVTTGANYPAIKDSDVLNYEISNPPLELQQQFATFVQQIDKSKFVVQKSLEKAETLYKSLMQEYFG